MGIRLKDIGNVIGIVGQAVPIVKGIIGKKKKEERLPIPTLPDDPYRDDRLLELAKTMATNAGKNASVAPQLLLADIMFVLVDAVRDGKILLPLNQSPSMTWEQVWDTFDKRKASE